MKKKLLTLLMAAVLMVANCVPVFAETQTMQVTANLNDTFTVSVPATLVLTDPDEDGTFTGTYAVSASGNIAGNKYVSIVPASSFTMTGATTSTNATAAVVQETQNWRRTAGTGSVAMDTEVNGNVSVALTVADGYAGNLVFTYGLNTD